MIFLFIVGLIVFLFSVVFVQETEVKVIQRFGKFKTVLSPGIGFRFPFIDVVAGVVSTRVKQLDLEVDTKTLDDVFVKIDLAVQYRIDFSHVRLAFYSLGNAHDQLVAYVFDTVRSIVPTQKLDQVFADKNIIAVKVKEQLDSVMKDYGFTVVTSLVTDIKPDSKVVSAMNEINANQRLLEATKAKAEAEKVVVVKNAEAQSESKRLQGEGIAKERLAIIEGLKKSADEMKVSGVSPEETMNLIMLTQYLDTLSKMGTDKVVYLSSSPRGMLDLKNDIIQAIKS